MDFCFQETHIEYDLFSTQMSDSCIMVLFLHITIEICRSLLRSKNHDRAPPADCTKVFHKRMVIFWLVFTKGEKTNTFYSSILTDLTEIILVLNGDLYLKYMYSLTHLLSRCPAWNAHKYYMNHSIWDPDSRCLTHKCVL